MVFNRSHLYVVAIIIAITVRAFIPSGYMPLFSKGKGFVITICSVNGPEHITVDADGNPLDETPQPDGQEYKEPCPFFMSNLAMGVAHEYSIVPGPVIFSRYKSYRPVEQRIRQIEYLRGPGARGPPSLI